MKDKDNHKHNSSDTANILSIAASISSMVVLLYQRFFNPNNTFILWFIVPLFIAFASLLIFFYISVSLQKNKEKKSEIEETRVNIRQEYEKIMSNLCSSLHSYEHNVRDLICLRIAETDNAQAFYTSCSQVCNLALEAYNHLWNNKYTTSVCIKRIINTENTAVEDWQLETIARSANTDTKRLNNENASTQPITVKGNTDFNIILNPSTKDTLFACTDLEKINESFKEVYKDLENTGINCYINTTKNYIDYYRSTIVVPIRIAISKTKAMANFDNKATHHVVGFLCIDNKEPFIDGDDLFTAGGEMAKVFADSIYKLFEDNIVYNKQLKENKVVNETVSIAPPN